MRPGLKPLEMDRDFVKELCGRLGISGLNRMQEAMAEACGQDKDVLLLSPVGSGKTLAYLLPLCGRVDFASDDLQAVVVVPSRELAVQSEEVFRSLRLSVRSASLYGGRPAMEEHRRLKEVKPAVVFATPGRLLDHLGKGNIACGRLSVFVVDEFDKCLELGFAEEMEQVAGYVPAAARRWLTSATDLADNTVFNRLCPSAAKGGFVQLDFCKDNPIEEGRLDVALVHSPSKDKLEPLAQLLSLLQGRPTIVFVSHRESVERVYGFLSKGGFGVSAYHGGMRQELRERSLYKFRSGSSNVLVSTDLASRGLDIPEVACIVHYHLPANEESYVHRCGRSTRWDGRGEVYLLLGPEEALPPFLSGVEAVKPLPPEGKADPVAPAWRTLYVGRGKKEKLGKTDIVGFLCKKGKLRAGEIGRIDIKEHYAYVAVARHKVKSLLNNIKGEKIKGMNTLIEEMEN